MHTYRPFNVREIKIQVKNFMAFYTQRVHERSQRVELQKIVTSIKIAWKKRP
jgi:hypothetical protein